MEGLVVIDATGPLSFNCGRPSCAAWPGKPCTTRAGNETGFHAVRRREWHEWRRNDASRRAEAEAHDRRLMVEASLANPMDTGSDVADFLRDNLRIRVTETVTCPDPEGYWPTNDVFVELLLCGEVLDRARIQ